MKHWIGLIGLVLGLVAVGIAIFQDDLREINEPKPAEVKVDLEEEESLTDLAMEAGKKLIKDKFLEKEEAPEPVVVERTTAAGVRDLVTYAYLGLGFLAIVLGVASWVRKEHIRVSGGAVALGLVAVSWQYVAIAVAIAIFILILANFSA